MNDQHCIQERLQCAFVFVSLPPFTRPPQSHQHVLTTNHTPKPERNKNKRFCSFLSLQIVRVPFKFSSESNFGARLRAKRASCARARCQRDRAHGARFIRKCCQKGLPVEVSTVVSVVSAEKGPPVEVEGISVRAKVFDSD